MSTTTIFDAIAASTAAKLRALLDGGADANAADDEGTPALHLAVRELHLGCMQALLEAGAGVNARSSESGETAAHLAVYDGFGEGLKLLLDCSSDLTLADDDGSSCLHLAAASKFASPDIIMTLMDAGAPARATDKAGRQPSHLAAARGRVSVLEALHASDATLILAVDADGATPIHAGAAAGEIGAIDWLAAHGANVEAADARGALPVFYALRAGKSTAADALVQ